MTTEIIRQTDGDASVTVIDLGNGQYEFNAFAGSQQEQIINELFPSLSAAVKRVTLFWIDEYNFEGTPIAKSFIKNVETV